MVTDIEWVDHMITLFGWMTPGEVRHFPLAQRDEAIAWAAAGWLRGHQRLPDVPGRRDNGTA